jgi:RHS repeat-associated protein
MSCTADPYDGEDHRVERQVTAGGATTTTAYYYMAGQRFAEEVNGALSFLASDGLGSATEAFDANGNVEGQALYAPYGAVRYSSGTMPTDYGFTGQRADAAMGLGFYHARYYDPAAGQFASADTTLAG